MSFFLSILFIFHEKKVNSRAEHHSEYSSTETDTVSLVTLGIEVIYSKSDIFHQETCGIIYLFVYLFIG